jgi:uncharacterized cupin superfamily protein
MLRAREAYRARAIRVSDDGASATFDESSAAIGEVDDGAILKGHAKRRIARTACGSACVAGRAREHPSYVLGMPKLNLRETPVHLGLGARCEPLPPFDGTMQWYERYGAMFDERDGSEGRLVSLHRFTESWPTWEMHPQGAELVLVIAGRMVLVQHVDGHYVRTELSPGEAAINPPGIWHPAEVMEPVSAVFITAGRGTEHSPEPPAVR